ncbi:MAG: hypothetical protein HON53_08670 [Planctomycetaceae bacterium]|nr:hypothetical protein [Planctomycetaceae bacterium]
MSKCKSACGDSQVVVPPGCNPMALVSWLAELSVNDVTDCVRGIRYFTGETRRSILLFQNFQTKKAASEHLNGVSIVEQQLVGANCPVCEKRIAVALDARECELCAFPVHKTCYDSYDPAERGDACPKCGAGRNRAAGYVAPEISPAGPESLNSADSKIQQSAGKSAPPQQVSRLLPDYRSLGDPLRKLRKFIGWTVLLWTLAALGLWFGAQGAASEFFGNVGDEILFGEDNFTSFFIFGTVFFLPPLMFLWLILPNRTTNAFYLRSFKNDAATLPVRVAAQAALGKGFRLSGIRNPRIRLSPIHRLLGNFLGITIFIFRYSSPKYMNLEAGADWKTRLAVSLGQSRCSLIDLTDITPFVSEEIRLTYHCLGPERVLFVTNSTRSEAEWREDIEQALGIPCDKSAFQISNWKNTKAGRQALRRDVQAFRDQLPMGDAGLNMPGAALLDSTADGDDAAPEHGWWSWWGTEIIGFLVAAALVVIAPAAMPEIIDGVVPFLMVFGVALLVYLLVALLQFLIDCGSRSKRMIASAFLSHVVLLAGGFGFLVWQAVAEVRQQALQARSRMEQREMMMLLNYFRSSWRPRTPPPSDGSNVEEFQQYFSACRSKTDDNIEAELKRLGLDLRQMDAREALVFWLGGVPRPVGSKTLALYGDDQTHPLRLDQGEIPESLYEFDTERLHDSDNDGWLEYESMTPSRNFFLDGGFVRIEGQGTAE